MSSNKNKVPTSIIIVHYNTPEFLKRCVRAILRSVVLPQEIVVIDNKSLTFPEKFFSRPSLKGSDGVKVLVVRNKRNLGFAMAVNQAARLVSPDSKYLLLINPDLIIDRFAVKFLWLTALRSGSDIVGGGTLDLETKEKQLVVVNEPNFINILIEFTSLKKALSVFGVESGFWNLSSLGFRRPKRVFGVSGCFMLIKKESFFKLNGFDPKFFLYLEDLDLCLRAQKLKMDIWLDPRVFGFHFAGASSFKNSPKHKIAEKYWRKSKEYFIRKHFSGICRALLYLAIKIDGIILNIKHIFDQIFVD